MTDFGVLEEGRARRTGLARQRRRRRRRTVLVTAAVLILAAVALLLLLGGTTGPAGRVPSARHSVVPPAPRAAARPADPYGVRLAAATVAPRLHGALRSGLLFDLRSGRVLWRRQPEWVLPIASLTKMMTALVVAGTTPPQARVLITRQALAYSGSGVGLLPLHRRVPALTLLYGLLLPSGNDAAIALALQVAQTQPRFVALMNARARSLGLSCTRFTSVSGIVDRGNHSCARDLARLAHAVLDNRLLARIVGTRDAVLPYPGRGGKLYLSNNNPLLRALYPGASGIKTGYTVAAGRCLVASARRGRRELAVVLLHSADPAGQAAALLDAGFRLRQI
jgi:D-alanyl-D-alanine carboxypeptidase (penicillin-binding protein 5/6)